MIYFRNFMSRLFILLFTYLFIYPAIIFSILVLGFTSSWKSGVVMLISALLLKIVLSLCSNNMLTRSSSEKEKYVTWDNPASHKAPPPLSEIDLEINYRKREQEQINEYWEHRQ